MLDVLASADIGTNGMGYTLGHNGRHVEHQTAVGTLEQRKVAIESETLSNVRFNSDNTSPTLWTPADFVRSHYIKKQSFAFPHRPLVC